MRREVESTVCQLQEYPYWRLTDSDPLLYNTGEINAGELICHKTEGQCGWFCLAPCTQPAFDPNLAKGKKMCVAISPGRDKCWAIVPKFSFLLPKCYLSFISLIVRKPRYSHRPTGNKYPDPGWVSPQLPPPTLCNWSTAVPSFVAGF